MILGFQQLTVKLPLAEVSNIISGNAMSNLFKENYKCDISTPRVLTDDPKAHLTEPTLVLPLETSIGNLTINLALKETA